MSEEDKGILSANIGMEVKDFPVKYLGVPLISTKLKAEDCKSIKAKILAQIQS